MILKVGHLTFGALCRRLLEMKAVRCDFYNKKEVHKNQISFCFYLETLDHQGKVSLKYRDILEQSLKTFEIKCPTLYILIV